MPLTTSLVEYWKMDAASGNETGAVLGKVLAENGGGIASTTGRINTARDFESGSNQYFGVASDADLQHGDVDFTWSGWVQLESKAANMTVFGKGNGSDYEVSLAYRSGTDRFRFHVYGAAGFGSSNFVEADNLGSPSTGVWYFVVCWHDATANTISIQVNDGTADGLSHSAGVYTSNANLRVGDDNFAGYWDGLIDELAFWKRALTSQERTDLYNGGAGLAYPFASLTRTQTAFRWRNDDGGETTATWAAAENATLSLAKLAPRRLRVQVDTTDDAPSEALRLEYRKVGDTTWLSVT